MIKTWFPTLILLISFSSANAQNKLFRFFPELVQNADQDTIPFSDLSKLVASNPSDFSQAFYDFGSPDTSEWSLMSENLIKYPEITQPAGYYFHLNDDAIQDLVISFRGGNEYTRIYIYFGRENGRFRNVYQGNAELFGQYQNGDLCLRHPACCTDPTDDFLRVSLSNTGKLILKDSLSISSEWKIGKIAPDSIFANRRWTTEKDTLHAITMMEGTYTYGSYHPGVKTRVIKEIPYKESTLLFCEVKGQLINEKVKLRFFPHAFIWVSRDN